MNRRHTHNRKLIRARRNKGWTQQQAADAVGVSLQTYCAWENCQRQPHPRWIPELSRVFGGANPEDLGF